MTRPSAFAGGDGGRLVMSTFRAKRSAIAQFLGARGQTGRLLERRELGLRFARLRRRRLLDPDPEVKPGGLPGDWVGIGVGRTAVARRQQLVDQMVEQE